ncbi:hypothetical protein [Rhizobium tubonense]|uniref:hypothetical protein n=1 Tax=Rhizobium tubonense TaxID=484088 RepID=UPI0018A81813|nr:hypothetical protein [Rhizobium tubonense]
MVSRNLPFEYFVLDRPRYEGAVIGYLASQPIRDVAIDAAGHRYRFAGLASRDGNGRLDVGCLEAGEWIVLPNLVYTGDARSPRRDGASLKRRFSVRVLAASGIGVSMTLLDLLYARICSSGDLTFLAMLSFGNGFGGQ